MKINDRTRKREEYWFTRTEMPITMTVERVGDMAKYPAYDEDGFRQVFHVLNPRRVSQTRGVTALAPMFDLAGMFGDINFAMLVRHQMVNCFAVIRQRSQQFDINAPDNAVGRRHETPVDTGVPQTLEGYGPGMMLNPPPGEDWKMDSPHVPAPEYFPFSRLILTLIGINIGMPLVMVLMDASETNFNGWRGAIEQARMGFRSNQRHHKNRLHKPVNLWWLRRELALDAKLRRWQNRRGIDIFKHRWNAPTWPYIQPLQDASADLLRIRNGLISGRRRAAERGIDYATLVNEIVEDNAAMIEAAQKKAAELNAKYPDLHVTWREVASLPTPDGVTIAVQPTIGGEGPETPAAPAKSPAA